MVQSSCILRKVAQFFFVKLIHRLYFDYFMSSFHIYSAEDWYSVGNSINVFVKINIDSDQSIVYCVSVSEDNVKKSLKQMGNQLKQLELDIRNAENDKSAAPNDRFAEVLKISFLLTHDSGGDIVGDFSTSLSPLWLKF